MSDSGGNNRPKIANLVQQIRNNNSANMSVLFYNFVTVLVSEFERNIYASKMNVGWIFIHFELNFWCFLLVVMTDHISAETGKSEFVLKQTKERYLGVITSRLWWEWNEFISKTNYYYCMFA